VVELVAGVVVEVGVVVLLLVLGAVLVVVEEGVVVELGVVVLLVVDRGVVVVGCVVELALVLWQSRAARLPRVLTPCRRLARSVGLSAPGRLLTAFPRPITALDAAPQLPELTAEETASSWLFRLED
jgi:hypothetical protein